MGNSRERNAQILQTACMYSMCMCLYVSVCARVSVCTHVWVCTFIDVFIDGCVLMCVFCICEQEYLWLLWYVCIFFIASLHICTSIFIYVYVQVCLYACTCTWVFAEKPVWNDKGFCSLGRVSSILHWCVKEVAHLTFGLIRAAERPALQKRSFTEGGLS